MSLATRANLDQPIFRGAMARSVLMMITLLGLYHQCLARGGYHFARFTGPVSGPAEKVIVTNSKHGGPSYDYVAKPDYQFAYGVEDPKTGNYQNQKEERHGDIVKGEYSLVGADGITRRVTYTAHPVHGFQAKVHTSPVNHEHLRQQERNWIKQDHRPAEEDEGGHYHEDDY